MYYLLASLIFFFLGPFFYLKAAKLSQPAFNIIQKILALFIIYVVIVHMIYESWFIIGWKALYISLIALTLSIVIETNFKKFATDFHLVFVVLCFIGLIAHMIFDGLVLFDVANAHIHLENFHNHSPQSVGWAIILHRPMMGILIWTSLRHHIGVFKTVALMLLLYLGSVIGYFGGHYILSFNKASVIMTYIQTIVAGTLIHIVWESFLMTDSHHHVSKDKLVSH